MRIENGDVVEAVHNSGNRATGIAGPHRLAMGFCLLDPVGDRLPYYDFARNRDDEYRVTIEKLI